MNTLRLILQNVRQGRISFKLPHVHQCTSSDYRGLVCNDPERCVGCGACAYSCPTAAIVVTRSGDNYSWAYDPGKCTFCGRCIDRCRPNCLTMESKLPPLYSRPGELQQVLHMVRKRPVRPVAPAAKPQTAANSGEAPAAASAAKPEAAAKPAEQPAPEPAG